MNTKMETPVATGSHFGRIYAETTVGTQIRKSEPPSENQTITPPCYVSSHPLKAGCHIPRTAMVLPSAWRAPLPLALHPIPCAPATTSHEHAIFTIECYTNVA